MTLFPGSCGLGVQGVFGRQVKMGFELRGLGECPFVLLFILRSTVVSGGRDGHGIVPRVGRRPIPASGKLDFVLTSSL